MLCNEIHIRFGLCIVMGYLDNIFRAVRRVIQLKTPWDVQKDLELEQVKSVNLQTLRNTPSYLNKVSCCFTILIIQIMTRVPYCKWNSSTYFYECYIMQHL